MKIDQDLTSEFLHNEHIVKQQSIRNIAKKTGQNKKQIQRLIQKFDINTKTSNSKSLKYFDVLSQHYLYQKYIKENKSINEISEEINIPSRTIGKYLHIHNISRKTGGTRKNKKNKKRFTYKNDIKVGHVYELLTVIDIKENQLICQCKCGNIKTLHTSRIRNKQVKSCGCLMHRAGVDSPNSKGYGSIPHSTYTRCKTNASDRSIDFNLTIENLDTQYKKQKGKCAISGIDIGFHNHKQKSKMLSTASLDRIDSDKSYEIGNIQWVHKKIQQMKWTTSQEEFIEWCKIIAANN